MIHGFVYSVLSMALDLTQVEVGNLESSSPFIMVTDSLIFGLSKSHAAWMQCKLKMKIQLLSRDRRLLQDLGGPRWQPRFFRRRRPIRDQSQYTHLPRSNIMIHSRRCSSCVAELVDVFVVAPPVAGLAG